MICFFIQMLNLNYLPGPSHAYPQASAGRLEPAGVIFYFDNTFIQVAFTKLIGGFHTAKGLMSDTTGPSRADAQACAGRLEPAEVVR